LFKGYLDTVATNVRRCWGQTWCSDVPHGFLWLLRKSSGKCFRLVKARDPWGHGKDCG